MNEIVGWIQDKAVLIGIAVLGASAAEVLKSETNKREFKLKYLIPYVASGFLVVGYIDSYDWPVGVEIAAAVAGGFVGKEILAFAGKKLKTKIGVDENGNDKSDRD